MTNDPTAIVARPDRPAGDRVLVWRRGVGGVPMSLVRPIKGETHNQGAISQPFDGAFDWEPRGYLRRSAEADRARNSVFAGSTYHDHLHKAIDYIAAIGTPVRAVKSGVIIGQGRNPYDGAELIYQRIRRTDKFDVTFLYYHLMAGSYRYHIGASVKRGATIALSGNTGWVTGPHCHTSLIRSPRGASISDIFNKGLYFDPQPFIDGTAYLRDIT